MSETNSSDRYRCEECGGPLQAGRDPGMDDFVCRRCGERHPAHEVTC